MNIKHFNLTRSLSDNSSHTPSSPFLKKPVPDSNLEFFNHPLKIICDQIETIDSDKQLKIFDKTEKLFTYKITKDTDDDIETNVTDNKSSKSPTEESFTDDDVEIIHIPRKRSYAFDLNENEQSLFLLLLEIPKTEPAIKAFISINRESISQEIHKIFEKVSPYINKIKLDIKGSKLDICIDILGSYSKFDPDLKANYKFSSERLEEIRKQCNTFLIGYI